ncbi:hypothetical protein [Herbiconiux liukaitaii]|uniref:hypothetical protein n=1 Tax=Herbiconiux liukaitaii TaxID=3342799 RepID=UPI0035B93AB6
MIGARGLAAAAAVVAVTTLVAVAATAAAAPAAEDGAVVELAPLVASWPSGYTVTGTKSEPLYVEHITSTRDGSVLSLTIDVKSQGESALGVQTGSVEVEADGSIRWLDGCTKPAEDCLDDPGLRGFLALAALLGAERKGTLPATGRAETLHGHPVVCVSDAALHPDSPPVVDGLDPCFSVATGAMLGHYSAESAAFVGPTLAEGLTDRPH